MHIKWVLGLKRNWWLKSKLLISLQPEAEFKELSRGSNMVGSALKIVFNISRFKPALNWNRFLADLRRALNSLNSDPDSLKTPVHLKYCSNFAAAMYIYIQTIDLSSPSQQYNVNGANLCYFKLWLFDLAVFIVWNYEIRVRI